MKTKKLISYGFIELLDDYTFEEINITMISQEAGISRRTFYRHFSDKDDVIRFTYHLLFDKRIAKINEASETFEETLIPFFEIFYDNRLILMKILKNNKHELLRQEIKEVISEHNRVSKPRVFKQGELFFNYYNDFHSSALFSIISTWILNDCTETTDEVVRVYKKIISEDF